MAPINRLIEPLAAAWSDLRSKISNVTVRMARRSKPIPADAHSAAGAGSGGYVTAWIGSAVQVIVRHLVSTRRDRNPGDAETAALPDCWILGRRIHKAWSHAGVF